MPTYSISNALRSVRLVLLTYLTTPSNQIPQYNSRNALKGNQRGSNNKPIQMNKQASSKHIQTELWKLKEHIEIIALSRSQSIWLLA